MNLTIEVDFDRLYRWLDKVDQALTNNPQAWRAMSIPYYSHVSTIFQKQGSPDKWPQLAESTKKQRRKKNHHIGVDTGQMRASTTGSASAGSVMQFSTNYLFIGSALKRTLWFHAGTTNAHGRQQQPPRPIFVKPDSHTTRLMLEAYLTVARRGVGQ